VAVFDPREQRWERPGDSDARPVGALAESPDGRIWTATGSSGEAGGGVAVYDPRCDHWERFSSANTPAFISDDGVTTDSVYSLCAGTEGTLWLSCGPGPGIEEAPRARVLRRDARGAWSVLRPGGADAEPALRYALCLRQVEGRERLWLAAANRGEQPAPVYALDPATGAWETLLPECPEGRVTSYRSIRRDREGALWLASYEGVVAFDGREWRCFHVGNSGIASNSAWEVCDTELGGRRLHWFATYGGLTGFDGETWETLTAEEGLAGTACFSVCDGGDGAVWAATPTGVSRYVPRADLPETFVISLQGRVHWREPDGSAECMELWDEARHAEGRDVRLRIGPLALAGPGGPAPTEVIYRDEIRLQFFAVDAWRKEEGDAFSFSCRLDGGPWTPYRRANTCHFMDLASGEHEIEVRAKNRWLNVDPTPARYTFRVDRLAEQLERERVRRDLEIGRQIQSQLLADTEVAAGPFATAARIQPAREVGGDFYRIFPLEGQVVGRWTADAEDQELTTVACAARAPRVGITLGDASGKGVPGALFMAVTVTLIQAHARRLASPAAVLVAVNEELYPQMRGGTRMFVTAFYGVLEPETRTLTFASAGQIPPLLLSRGGPARSLRHPGLPLGAFPHPRYEDLTAHLSPGDTLLLMSDGFVEAFRGDTNGAGEMFGFTRLRAAAEAAADSDLPTLLDRLFQAVQEYAGDNAGRDDLTLLALRCTE
jgi:serine phosphatase RsbU (regulator of sigma subunit)